MYTFIQAHLAFHALAAAAVFLAAALTELQPRRRLRHSLTATPTATLVVMPAPQVSPSLPAPRSETGMRAKAA